MLRRQGGLISTDSKLSSKKTIRRWNKSSGLSSGIKRTLAKSIGGFLPYVVQLSKVFTVGVFRNYRVEMAI